VVIEGCLIAAYAIDAHYAFIYIRGEFWHIAQVLEHAVEEAYAAGLAGENIFGTEHSCEVIVYRGAGAYICGEESGLLSSLEGKRGYPRNRPPFPAVEGLYRAPTVVNNVETLACLPSIIRNGADWYASLGTQKSKGTKLVAVSGHVRKPGVYEIELGKLTLRQIIDDLAGGVREGHAIKGVIPGGSSMPIVPADKIDVPYDYESIESVGSMLGSGGIIVLDDSVDMVEMALLLAKFYAHESCGQCTPCREGTKWLVQILEAIYEGRGHPDDIDTMRALFETEMTSICLLWSAVIMPVRALLQHYEEEFRAAMARGTPDVSRMGQPGTPVPVLSA
jgi:NADH-quinone oxidoreductase subunit F